MLHFFWSGYNLSENSYSQYEYSNHEIAKWAEYYLGRYTSFHQSSWCAGKVTDKADDILLGHLTWDSRNQVEKSTMKGLLRNWVKDNALLPTQSCHPNTYILTPWVPEFPPEWLFSMPYVESQLIAARKIFALCGDIWIKRTLSKVDDSIQSLVKEKLINCNMGVAANNFSINKQRFNKIGERQILHISNLASYKGFDITCKSLEGLETLLHVASFSIQAPIGLLELSINGHNYVVNFLGGIDNNDPQFNQWVADNCDFYIHTARMDAQATTILENCARGLIPLVTPESGFSSPHAIYLTQDQIENRKIIKWALNLPEPELLKRSHLIREQVIKEHNWEGIFGKIWSEIMADIDSRSCSASNYQSDLEVRKDVCSNKEERGETHLIATEESIKLSSNSFQIVDQRLYINRNQLLELEKQVRFERHIERYTLLRQFAKGVVCDAACGCGYGSYLLATNPDVERVIGLDAEPDAISYARNEYAVEKTEFHVANLEEWVFNQPIDMLLSVETVEHLKDKLTLLNFVNRNSINHVILTYPSKKTTHYNSYHYYDFRLQDILDIFSDFTCYRNFNWQQEFDVVFLIRNHS